MSDKYIHFASNQPKGIQVKNLESLYNNKNFIELIKYSEVFLKKFPESKFIYNLIGVSYFNLGKYLDSPATTSAVTYQCWVGGYSNSLDSHVNRSPRFLDSGDGNYDSCPSSSLSLWEFRP